MRPPRPVVVIGDALLDVDVEGTVDRLCPDAPAPVLAVTAEQARPGGAGLAAALVAGRGVPVRLVTALEADEAGERLRGLLDGALTLVTGPATGGTVVKCRLARRRAVAAADRPRRGPPGRRLRRGDRRRPGRRARRRRRGAGVRLRPRGRGGPGGARRARPGRGPPGAGGVGPAPARRAAGAGRHGGHARTWPRPAARPAIDVAGSGVGAALALGADLVARWDVRAVAVTLGGRGAVVRHRHGACAAAPAPAVAETDPCGAGDHFAGGVAARLAAGATVDEAVADAVTGAAEFVARGGGAAVRRVGDAWCQPAAARLPAGPAGAGHRPRRARALVARVRSAGGTVVATGGVFDPLHRGHTESLAAARALGDCLLVLVNSDASVRRRTGAAAPARGPGRGAGRAGRRRRGGRRSRPTTRVRSSTRCAPTCG